VDILSLEALAGDEMLLALRKGEAEPRVEELMDCVLSLTFFLPG
jgi:hypothetical protein